MTTPSPAAISEYNTKLEKLAKELERLSFRTVAELYAGDTERAKKTAAAAMRVHEEMQTLTHELWPEDRAI